MTALAQPWLNYRIGESLARVPLRVASCPGCSLDPQHPTARTCDRIGCPIKHLGACAHAHPIIVSEARHHG